MVDGIHSVISEVLMSQGICVRWVSARLSSARDGGLTLSTLTTPWAVEAAIEDLIEVLRIS